MVEKIQDIIMCENCKHNYKKNMDTRRQTNFCYMGHLRKRNGGIFMTAEFCPDYEYRGKQ